MPTNGGSMERHYMDAGCMDTVIWIYIFLFSSLGQNLFPRILLPLIFSKSFHYSWVLVVSADLGRAHVPDDLTVQTNTQHGIKHPLSQPCTVEEDLPAGGWGDWKVGHLDLGCILESSLLTFGPQQVFTLTPTLTTFMVLEWLGTVLSPSSPSVLASQLMSCSQTDLLSVPKL